MSPQNDKKKREVDNLETGFSKVFGISSWSVKQHVLLTQLYFTSTYLASPVHSHSLLGHFTWQDRIFLSVALSGNISCKETNNHLQSKLITKYLAGKLKKKKITTFIFLKFWHTSNLYMEKMSPRSCAIVYDNVNQIQMSEWFSNYWKYKELNNTLIPNQHELLSEHHFCWINRINGINYSFSPMFLNWSSGLKSFHCYVNKEQIMVNLRQTSPLHGYSFLHKRTHCYFKFQFPTV